MFKSKLVIQITAYLVSIIVIAFFAYYSVSSNINKRQKQAIADLSQAVAPAGKEIAENPKIPTPNNNPIAAATQAPKSEKFKESATPQPTSASTAKPTIENKQETSQSTPTSKPVQNLVGVTINKSDITSTAKFYPITVDGVSMELLAVRATDGSVRTALNTCQVCYSSGRGYYVQTGDTLVCQNCKNRFKVDQIEVVKGGCNPVPILAENKVDNGKSVFVAEAFLRGQKELFLNWKR